MYGPCKDAYKKHEICFLGYIRKRGLKFFPQTKVIVCIGFVAIHHQQYLDFILSSVRCSMQMYQTENYVIVFSVHLPSNRLHMANGMSCLWRCRKICHFLNYRKRLGKFPEITQTKQIKTFKSPISHSILFSNLCFSFKYTTYRLYNDTLFEFQVNTISP